MSLISSLPEDTIIDCISRLPRRDYPTLSLVSKYFRSLITSHELYARRLLLDRTENCLYVTLSNKADNNDGGHDRLYTLRQNFNSPDDKKYSLVPVSSLPPIPPRGSYVAVDSKIFVIPDDESHSPTDTLLIDCRFHTAHYLPSMPSEVGSSVCKYASVGEIHIGGFKVGLRPFISDGVVMFSKEPETLVRMFQWAYSSVMTSVSSRYMRFSRNHSAYDQNKDKWYDNEYFLDGVSYVYNLRLRELQAFDLRRDWKRNVVKGVEIMTGEEVSLSRTVVYGGKVVVFLQKEFDEKKEIWCAEIKVERDEEGELCGRVAWCGCVLEGQWLTVKNSLTVKL